MRAAPSASVAWRAGACLALAAVLAARGAAADAGAPPGAPERVTLQEALKRALARNPSVTSARAEIDRADALITQARAGYYPTLVGNGTYTRLDSERRIKNPDPKMPSNVIASKDQIAANLQLTVP